MTTVGDRFKYLLVALLVPSVGAEPPIHCVIGLDGTAHVRLGWNSTPEKTYVVESTTDPGGPWLVSAIIQATGDVSEYGLGVNGSARFLRVAESSASLPNPDPQRWVWIPPGTFLMGSPLTEVDRSEAEGPQTVVRISQGFWMGRHEVTQSEYEAVMGHNPALFLGDFERPVDSVSWSDSTDYCARLTERERAEGRLPAGFVYRLPTEAEWEHACRAGTTTRFDFGDDLGYTEIEAHAWMRMTSWVLPQPPGVSVPFESVYYTTHPVGAKKPNRLGLYDLRGNVWEWCWDAWSPQLPGGSVTDPQGPGAGGEHVIRGGGWSSFAQWCRSAYRMPWDDRRMYFMGLRPVLARPLE